MLRSQSYLERKTQGRKINLESCANGAELVLRVYSAFRKTRLDFSTPASGSLKLSLTLLQSRHLMPLLSTNTRMNVYTPLTLTTHTHMIKDNKIDFCTKTTKIISKRMGKITVLKHGPTDQHSKARL